MIAAEIWRLVRADPTLRFNDIAVVVPEAPQGRYLSHVGAVFGEAHDLPHSVIDLPLGGGHRSARRPCCSCALPFGVVHAARAAAALHAPVGHGALP